MGRFDASDAPQKRRTAGEKDLHHIFGVGFSKVENVKGSHDTMAALAFSVCGGAIGGGRAAVDARPSVVKRAEHFFSFFSCRRAPAREGGRRL